MVLVNQLIQQYGECRATNRDMYLSFELRDEVEIFSFKIILRPSSPPPSSGEAGEYDASNVHLERGIVQMHHLMCWTVDTPGPVATVLSRRGEAHPWLWHQSVSRSARFTLKSQDPFESFGWTSHHPPSHTPFPQPDLTFWTCGLDLINLLSTGHADDLSIYLYNRDIKNEYKNRNIISKIL